MDLGRAVEESSWDGLYVWDHVLRPESNEIIDTWVALAALVTATRCLRLGPMVTPVPRRRLIKLVGDGPRNRVRRGDRRPTGYER